MIDWIVENKLIIWVALVWWATYIELEVWGDRPNDNSYWFTAGVLAIKNAMGFALLVLWLQLTDGQKMKEISRSLRHSRENSKIPLDEREGVRPGTTWTPTA